MQVFRPMQDLRSYDAKSCDARLAIWQRPCKKNGHEENTSCIVFDRREYQLRADIGGRENWSAAATSRYPRPTACAGAGLLLGRRLLVPGWKPLQVA
jgi:hypothetical protein